MKDRQLFEEEYRICGILGFGRFATVYRCMHRDTGQYYAAKLLTKHLSLVDTEVNVLTQFKHHKNIVSLVEVFRGNKEVVLVMELVPGRELIDVLGTVISSEYDLSHVVKHLCSTLYCLHYKHVIHMDIKPENIMVYNTLHKPRFRLVDFGLARVLQFKKPERISPDKLQGDMGDEEDGRIIRGTPEFLPPEILLNSDCDASSPAVDMWCLGVTIYIALTGVSPFLGEDHYHTVHNILHRNCYLGEELFGAYSEDALDFLSRLLHPSPNARLTAAECLAHPWLSKKKRAKQRDNPLRSHVPDAGFEPAPGDLMAGVRRDLRELSECDNNIKPSSVTRKNCKNR